MRKILVFIALLLFVASLPLLFVLNERKHIYTGVDVVEPTAVAIVFGAGIKSNGEPSDALRDRLTIAAELFHQQKIERILVSGDNRFENYSEPDVMRTSLVDEFEIPVDRIYTDYAGRRTYDTCIRAHDLWGVDEAILVTQGYHLPRAIWTCKRLGIESEGVGATLQLYVFEDHYKIREILAIFKAFFDLYLVEPEYIGGNFEEDIDP